MMSAWRSALQTVSVQCLLMGSLGSILAAEVVPAPGTLLELQEVKYTSMKEWNDQFTKKIAQDLGAKAADFQTLGPQTVFKNLITGYLTDAVPSMGLKYASVDSHGHPRTYSGRIFLPTHVPGTPPRRLPLVIYQHGTETRKKYVPYYNEGDETMLGALGAQANGFAVAMPDGDGMGADPSREIHAYCHGFTTAKCLIDMIRAIQGNSSRIFDGINHVWDGRLFIMGYSEGGYIAMAAVKELGSNPAYKDIKLTGAACMGGPFNLPSMTQNLLKAGAEPYTRPYIPAYLLRSWEELYPRDIVYKDLVNPKFLETQPSKAGNPDLGSLAQWLEGVLGGDEISPLMRARLTGDKDEQINARGVVNEAWAKANVDVSGSRVNQLLEANNLVGNWKPTVPVLLAHDPFDECVPFSNSQTIFESWSRQGFQPLSIIRLAVGERGSGHVGGAILSVPTAFAWIGAGMPASVMTMAASTLTTQILAGSSPGLAEVVNKAAVLATQNQNVNRAEFPLSRIEYQPKGQAGPWTVTLADRFVAVGKVKIYTLAQFPQFMGQQPVPGHTYYTKFVKQLKELGDSCPINPEEPTFMAVYPQNGLVGLTLSFSGMTSSGSKTSRLNIKQVKNKLLGSASATFDGDSDFLRGNLRKDGFENPASAVPFLTIPQ